MGSCVSVDAKINASRVQVDKVPGSPPPVYDIQQKDSTAVSNVVSLPVRHKDVEDLRKMCGYGHVNIFSYDELAVATKGFLPEQILGEGGFGPVYKGVIDHDVRQGFERTEVAVKKLNPEGLQGEKEWLTEINCLGQLSHPNLVKLVGYCCEDDHRLLVYEYMASGSLEKQLFHRRVVSLPWMTRLSIALDAANGLAFLHGSETPIIYRDFKTSNILLDAEFNGKLSDFGLAKEGPVGEQTHVSTRVMGTHGYAAPEYMMSGHLTAKSDVYGYGVVLLEMLLGRRAFNKNRPSKHRNLVEWACPLLTQSAKLQKIVDPRMEGGYTIDGIERVAKLAYSCLSHNPRRRPSMSEVVDMLKNVIEAEKSMLRKNPEAAVNFHDVPKERVIHRTEPSRRTKERRDAMREPGRRTTATRSTSHEFETLEASRSPLQQQGGEILSGIA